LGESSGRHQDGRRRLVEIAAARNRKAPQIFKPAAAWAASLISGPMSMGLRYVPRPRVPPQILNNNSHSGFVLIGHFIFDAAIIADDNFDLRQNK
jgi:hypothetical protein